MPNLTRRSMFGAVAAIVAAVATPKVMAATPDDRVQKTLAWLKANLGFHLNTYLFEPNDAFCRYQVTNHVTQMMEALRTRGDIKHFRVVCDEFNNPLSAVNRNELNVDVYFVPAPAPRDRIYAAYGKLDSRGGGVKIEPLLIG